MLAAEQDAIADKEKVEARLYLSTELFMDLPTLLLISTFSAFVYYLAKVNSQLEIMFKQQSS